MKKPYSLKNLTVKMSDSVDVDSTNILDGEASNPSFLTESNETVQYKTPGLGINKKDLGGENNQNG